MQIFPTLKEVMEIALSRFEPTDYRPAWLRQSILRTGQPVPSGRRRRRKGPCQRSVGDRPGCGLCAVSPQPPM